MSRPGDSALTRIIPAQAGMTKVWRWHPMAASFPFADVVNEPAIQPKTSHSRGDAIQSVRFASAADSRSRITPLTRSGSIGLPFLTMTMRP